MPAAGEHWGSLRKAPGESSGRPLENVREALAKPNGNLWKAQVRNQKLSTTTAGGVEWSGVEWKGHRKTDARVTRPASADDRRLPIIIPPPEAFKMPKNQEDSVIPTEIYPQA
jgi:hypothetical protein